MGLKVGIWKFFSTPPLEHLLPSPSEHPSWENFPNPTLVYKRHQFLVIWKSKIFLHCIVFWDLAIFAWNSEKLQSQKFFFAFFIVIDSECVKFILMWKSRNRKLFPRWNVFSRNEPFCLYKEALCLIWKIFLKYFVRMLKNDYQG